MDVKELIEKVVDGADPKGLLEDDMAKLEKLAAEATKLSDYLFKTKMWSANGGAEAVKKKIKRIAKAAVKLNDSLHVIPQAEVDKLKVLASGRLPDARGNIYQAAVGELKVILSNYYYM